MLTKLTHHETIPLVEDTSPVLLEDKNAGLMFRTYGETTQGFAYVTHTNPNLIADVIEAKTRAREFTIGNELKWS